MTTRTHCCYIIPPYDTDNIAFKARPFYKKMNEIILNEHNLPL